MLPTDAPGHNDSSSATHSRRSLLGAIAGSGATLALAGAGFTGGARLADAALQIEATPPVVAPPPIPQPSIAGKAAELGYDMEAIFRFVADEIAYEPYGGILRGAIGTLWARAGNAADQATLFAALLEASVIPWRFALGRLDEDAVARLATQVASDSETIIARFDSAAAASVRPVSAPAATLTPEEQELADQSAAAADARLRTAGDLVSNMASLIASALTEAAITLPDVPLAAIPDAERAAHAWLQVADGPAWIDLDPAIPDFAPGDALTTATETLPALPDSLLHTIRIRLEVEELFGGVPQRREVVALQSSSDGLAATPLALAMTGPREMDGVGLAINDQFNGAVSFTPCIVAGENVATTSTPFVFGSGREGVIGALDTDTGDGLVDGETLAVWIVADVQSPGAAPVTVERSLVDRIGRAARASGVIDPTGVAQVSIVDDGLGGLTIPELAGLTIITTDVGRIPGVYAARDPFSADLYGQLHLFGPGYASLRNAIARAQALPAGFDMTSTAPALTSFTVSLIDAADASLGMEIATDLIVPATQAVALPGALADGMISPFITAGVINQVAEQLLIEPLTRTTEDATQNTTRPTAGDILALAAGAGIAIRAIRSPDGLAQLGHGADATARIAAQLDLGMIVIVPETTVDIDGTARSAWWIVDPLTGRFRDEIETGEGFAGAKLRVPIGALNSMQIAGYTRLLNNLRMWAGPYILLGKCIAFVAAMAAHGSDYGNSKDAVDAFIETFKNVNPEDAKKCFG